MKRAGIQIDLSLIDYIHFMYIIYFKTILHDIRLLYILYRYVSVYLITCFIILPCTVSPEASLKLFFVNILYDQWSSIKVGHFLSIITKSFKNLKIYELFPKVCSQGRTECTIRLIYYYVVKVFVS